MSEQAKHTPGPLVKSPYSSAVGTLISTTGGRHVAAVMPQSVASEAIANADLFLAAPDLLAAAIAQEEAEDFYHNHCPDADDHGEDMPELCEHCFPYFDKARCMRRAAIAKAKGIAK